MEANNNSVLMLKVIFASLFVVMVIVRKIQNNKAHEENEDEVDDETYEAQEKNNNASVASNTPKQSVLNVAHLLIVMTLIVIISIGIIIKVRSYTKLTNSEYPLMVGEISMENMPVVEILNNQETNRSQAGHYPLKTKGTITYSINVHTNGDDFSIDDNSTVDIEVKKIANDTLYISAKLVYKQSDQIDNGKEIHYKSINSYNEMSRDERTIHNQCNDLLQKEFEATVDNKGRVFVDIAKYKRGRIPEDLMLHFLFAGLPSETVQVGTKWQKSFKEEPVDKNVIIGFTISGIDNSIIATQSIYNSSFSGGSLPCTGYGNYYFDKKTLLVDSGNLEINIGYGVKYSIRINNRNKK